MIEMQTDEQGSTGYNTWYKTLGLSVYSCILLRITFCVTRQESSPQSPAISYRQPLAAMIKRKITT